MMVAKMTAEMKANKIGPPSALASCGVARLPPRARRGDGVSTDE